MNSKRDKTIISVLMVLTIVFTLAGGTLALWVWNSTGNTGVTFTITPDFSCSADGGGDITNEEVALAPTKNCNGSNVIKRQITVSTDITNEGTPINMDLWLEASGVGTALANSDYFKYRVTTSEDCNEDIISSGTFTDLQDGSKNNIFNNLYGNSVTETYYLYIWLGHEETNNLIQNQTFNLSLGGKCEMQPNPEKPVLDPGMIPVTIANDGTVTTIKETDPNWYDYSNKEWANVVLVNSDSRDGYLEILNDENGENDNTIVAEEDILAYYVWIPRYKYQVWTNDATKTTSPQTIGILFEDKDAPISKTTSIGEYMTHPAFVWGDKTVAGIWVGKFEPSVEKTSMCYTSPLTANCNNTDHSLRIVPNVSSLRFQQISNQFKTSLKFANGTMSDAGTVTFATNKDNIYGLNTEVHTTNSHMMKNSEWGAVAYLSHSLYGINTEIRMNNNSSYITGCGASTEDGTYSSDCEIEYGLSTTYPQSTTGNISGIFDMSGGTFEYVMGNYGKKTNTFFPTLPIESKYYDVYPSSQFTGTYATNMSLCTLGNSDICNGHSLYETSGWYSDYAAFAISNYPWVLRGGYWENGPYAGAFLISADSGGLNKFFSWRSVLITDVVNG